MSVVSRSRSRLPVDRADAEMQKNPKLRTVVNKLNSIHATYRYFDMEVLAGEPDFITMVVRRAPSTKCSVVY